MYHFLQVSTTSFKTNLSESSNEKNVGLGLSQVFPAKMPPSANDSNKPPIEKLDLPIPGTFDPSETQSEIPLLIQNSSPQEKQEQLSFPSQSEDDIAKPSSLTPDSNCQTDPDSPDDRIIKSSESTSTPPGSGSPQLDQLLSDLEEMKLKFRPETLDPPLSVSTDESPEVDQIYKYAGLSAEDKCPTEDGNTVSVSMTEVTEHLHFQTSIEDENSLNSLDPTTTPETSVPIRLGEPNDYRVSPTESCLVPESPQIFRQVLELSLKSGVSLNLSPSRNNCDHANETFSSVSSPKIVAQRESEMPEKNLANVFEVNSTTESLQSQEECESTLPSDDTNGLKEETSTQSVQYQIPQLREAASVEDTRTEDLSSQSVSDLTPETVTSARRFSFEELMPYHSSGNVETSSDDDRPMTSGPYSEESLTPEDCDCFASKSTSVKPKAEMTSSTSDEEYSIPPGYAETSSTHMPPGYAEVVHSGKDSPNFEYSDPEPFFDCKQAASDFSETEPDEPESKASSTESQHQDHFSNSRVPRVQGRVTRGVLLSSGSEDYEDAPFVHEPLHTVHEEREEFLHYSEASDEEFLLCEASQLPPVCEIGAYDTDNTLTRVR